MRADPLIVLTVWRELRGRILLWLVLPAAAVALRFVPPEVRIDSASGMIFALVPLVVLVGAARLGQAGDLWWRALGGPVLVVMMTRALLHVLLIGVPAGAIAYDLHRAGAPLPAAYAASLAFLYAATTASRSLAPSGAAMFWGVLATAVVIGLDWIPGRTWPRPDAIVWRLAASTILAMPAALLWEKIYGPWGGTVRRHARAIAPLSLLLLLVALIGAEAMWRVR